MKILSPIMRRPSSVPLLLALAVASVGVHGCGDPPVHMEPVRQNVLVLLLDTLRADHLGYDGYERATSPNLDAFSKECLRFPRAFTATPWTPPAVATIFTGLYTTSHGMLPADQEPQEGALSKRLDESALTLAEILKGAGYRTAAVSSNPWITPEFGYGQGFDSFDLRIAAPADQVTDAGLARIDELQAGDAPFLLYLHYLDPHGPYEPPEGHRHFEGQPGTGTYGKWMQKCLDRYDGEIHYLDQSLGRLFAELRAKGLWDDLAIVLIGDHGEQFGERGHEGHGWQLYNEELRVPLLVKRAGAAAGRSVERVVSNVDVLPTVLDFAGAPPPPAVHGITLLDEPALAARPGVFAEIDRFLCLRAFVDAKGRKLILGSETIGEAFDHANPASRIVGLFDATGRGEPRLDDPGLQSALEGRLREMLDLVAASKISPTSEGVRPSDETIQRLQSLGYVR